AGLDEDEVAGPVLHRLLERRAVLVPDPPGEDVQHHFEADVDVRGGDAARRNRGDVHRQLFRVGVLRGQAGAILNPVPPARDPAAANDEDAVEPFDGSELILRRGVGHDVLRCIEAHDSASAITVRLADAPKAKAAARRDACGITAVTSISTFARSSISARTSTALIAA